MKNKGHRWYVIAFVLMLAFCAAYALHRDLPGRYRAYQESEESVRKAAQNVQTLQAEVDRANQRLKDLDSDAVELEATIRRIKRLVREGETVYRFEPAPAIVSQP
jgi:cell division protein FtsB